MGRAADTRAKILNAFSTKGDLIPDAVLRVKDPGTRNASTRSFTSPSYTGYVCKAFQDNRGGVAMRNLMSANPEIQPTDKMFWLTYTGTLNTYNSSWVLQSSASTTARPEPRKGKHQIYADSILYDVIVATDMSIGIGGLFQVIARRVA